MELWDLYNENREPLNRTIQRGQEIPKGEYHVAVAVWVANSARQLLLTLRAPEKQPYPNKWENPGGSALAGETSRQGIRRELEEETAIAAKEEAFTLLGSFRGKNTFMDVYFLRHDAPISSLTMQKGETAGAQWAELPLVYEMARSEALALPIGKHLTLVKKALERELEKILL